MPAVFGRHRPVPLDTIREFSYVSTTNTHEKSFFATLFDFGFTSFITLRFLKTIYAIVVALVLLGGLISLIYGLSSGSALGVISGLILAPLGTLVYLVLARIGLEVVAMFFRIGDNTAHAVELLGGRQQPFPAQPVPAQQPPVQQPPAQQPPVQQPPAQQPPAQQPPAPVADQPLDEGQPTTVFPVQPPAHGSFSAPPAPGGEQAAAPPTPATNVNDEGWGPTTKSS